MITKAQRKNAERIVELADNFGHLPFNVHGQTVEGTLNLSIPTARLIVADIVTGVRDTNDGINDNAVADVERLCVTAVQYQYPHELQACSGGSEPHMRSRPGIRRGRRRD